MRLCTKCNRMLKSTDKYCPYCAGEKVDDAPSGEVRSGPAPFVRQDSAPREPIPEAEQAQAVTLEIPLSDIDNAAVAALETPPEPAEQAVDAADTPARHDGIEPQGVTVEIPLDDSGLPEPDEEDFEPEFDDAGMGYIEQQLEAYGEPEEGHDPMSKLSIVLIALMVVAVALMGFLLVRKALAPAVMDNETFAAHLEGTWLSQQYYFQEEGEGRYFVDYLTLRADGTFTLLVLEPNRSIPNGYETGDWEVYKEYTGTYTVDAGQGLFRLFYGSEGEDLFMTRQVLDISDGAITLREYYNEQLTEYFDLSYTRAA